MAKDPRYEVENEEVRVLLTQLGTFLHSEMPKGYGFGLFIFGFQNTDMFWLSDANRKDIIKALKEFIKKEEGN